MKCFQRKGKHIANNITFERIPFIALRRSRGRPAPQSTVTEIYVCIEVRFFAKSKSPKPTRVVGLLLYWVSGSDVN